MKHFFVLLGKSIEPRSMDLDDRRREQILNIILVATMVLSGIAIISVSIGRIIRAADPNFEYHGVPAFILLLFASSFAILYFFSRAGFYKTVSYVLIFIYFTAATYTIYTWGADAPQGLLVYFLTLIISSVLISTQFSLVVLTMVSIALLSISFLQTQTIIEVNTYWRTQPLIFRDTIVAVVTLGVAAIVAWLSNREIEKSLKRARTSEKALGKERNLLEVKVEQRTRELKKVRMEKMQQLYRSAEFGRLSSGLFHDLVNPLTAISLNLGQIKDVDIKGLAETKVYLEQAIATTKRMESFIIAVRKQIAKQGEEILFSLCQEITQTIDLLSYYAKKVDVGVIFYPPENIRTFGDPIKFCQVVTNLMSNAIDSYGEIKSFGKRRDVFVKLTRKDGFIYLTVQDWGRGIPSENINKIFDPFFTTKSTSQDLGIGLSIVKNITEKDFKGTIKVESKPREGTIFTIKFPQKQKIYHFEH
ncbi:MAG: HAMP domain-containing histidine kinase [Patescibacteria group bacterium]|nr:HAMP domain-containing histidine kinase [Patescibacteria group bacterium]